MSPRDRDVHVSTYGVRAQNDNRASLWNTAGIVKSLLILAALLVGAAPFFARQIPSQSLKVDVDLVMINATVTADEGHYVTGLQKKDFHVWEDKVEQPVAYLSTEDVPASVGLIVDVSLSMQSFGAYARQEALTFLQSLNAESEYFLMLFAGKPRVEIDLTKDIAKVQNLPFIPYQCCTALYDAGLPWNGKNQKSVLSEAGVGRCHRWHRQPQPVHLLKFEGFCQRAERTDFFHRSRGLHQQCRRRYGRLRLPWFGAAFHGFG